MGEGRGARSMIELGDGRCAATARAPSRRVDGWRSGHRFCHGRPRSRALPRTTSRQPRDRLRGCREATPRIGEAAIARVGPIPIRSISERRQRPCRGAAALCRLPVVRSNGARDATELPRVSRFGYIGPSRGDRPYVAPSAALPGWYPMPARQRRQCGCVPGCSATCRPWRACRPSRPDASPASPRRRGRRSGGGPQAPTRRSRRPPSRSTTGQRHRRRSCRAGGSRRPLLPAPRGAGRRSPRPRRRAGHGGRASGPTGSGCARSRAGDPVAQATGANHRRRGRRHGGGEERACRRRLRIRRATDRAVAADRGAIHQMLRDGSGSLRDLGPARGRQTEPDARGRRSRRAPDPQKIRRPVRRRDPPMDLLARHGGDRGDG